MSEDADAIPAPDTPAPAYEDIRDYRTYRQSPSFQSALRRAAATLRANNVRGVYFAFPSVDGRALGKLIALDDFEQVATTGIRLHYGAIADARVDLYGDLIGFSETSVEGLGIPDLSTLKPVPWNSAFAQLLCFLYDEQSGSLLDHDSRGNLLRVETAFMKATGFEMHCAIEPEMMWLREDAHGHVMLSTRSTSTYSLVNFHDHEALILDILDYSARFGIAVRGVDSEESSQLEFNQRPDTPLAFADRFFRYRQVCHAAASKHGLICTFMPKPFTGESGNGAHHNLSVVDSAGQNLMADDHQRECGLSELGLKIVAGLLEHADGMTMIGAPTVNSYKRFWDLGHWAAFVKAYGKDNRTCLVRVTAGPRIELRHFDAAVNPYHSIAACVMASLDGIRRSLDPGPPCAENVMRDLRLLPERHIPLTLADAMKSFEADDLMREVFPPNLHRALLEARADEWHRFWAQVSQWERDFYLRRWP